MDVFTEQLSKRKLGLIDYIIISFVIFFILLEIAFFNFNILFLAIILLSLYIGLKIISSRFVEFEYTVVNDNITIDKIINKRNRKEVISFSLSEIEELNKYSKNVNMDNYDEIYKAYTTDSIWYATFKKNGGKKIIVLFSPNKKTIESIKPFLKRRILINAFNRD